jgi:excisionase family DNA binding protein
MGSDDHPGLLTREEAAKRCRVSLGTFDEHIRPALRVKRVGARVLIPESEVARWIASGESEQTETPIAPVGSFETGTRSGRKPAQESGTFARVKLSAEQSEQLEPRILRKLRLLEQDTTRKHSRPGLHRANANERNEQQTRENNSRSRKP